MIDHSAPLTFDDVIFVLAGVKLDQTEGLRQFGWVADATSNVLSKKLADGELWIDSYEKGIFVSFLDGTTDGILPALTALYGDLETLELDVFCEQIDINAKISEAHSLSGLVKKRGFTAPTRELPAIKVQSGATTRISRIGNAVWISASGDFHSFGSVKGHLESIFSDFTSIGLLHAQSREIGLALA